MQCFICVTYLFIIAIAHPDRGREPPQIERRSLFHDVIESLRIRSQLPEDYTQNENNVAENYRPYELDSQEKLPSDNEFIPRRNDRLEMPPLKYRYPKSLTIADTDFEPREEIVLYITDTTIKDTKTTTQKPKKTKRTRPPGNKKTPRDEEVTESVSQKPELEFKPVTNHMAGQSQIGNRDSQMVVKPTVIVNLRGSVNHKDGEIRINGRNRNDTNDTRPFQNSPQNVFNINQEIKLERTFEGLGSTGGQKNMPSEYSEYKVHEKTKVDEDMMMCETATWNPEKNREDRKYRNVLQILLSV